MNKNSLQRVAEIYDTPSLSTDHFLEQQDLLERLAMGSDVFDFQTQAIKVELNNLLNAKSVEDMLNEFNIKIATRISYLINSLQETGYFSKEQIKNVETEAKEVFYIKNGTEAVNSDLFLKKYFEIAISTFPNNYINDANLFIYIFDFLETNASYILHKISEIESAIIKTKENNDYIQKYIKLHLEKIENLKDPVDFSDFINKTGVEITSDFAQYIYDLQIKRKNCIGSIQITVQEEIGKFCALIVEGNQVSGNKIEKIYEFLMHYFIDEWGWYDCTNTFDIYCDLRRIYIQKYIADILEKDNISEGLKILLLKLIKDIGIKIDKNISEIQNIKNEYDDLINTANIDLSDL